VLSPEAGGLIVECGDDERATANQLSAGYGTSEGMSQHCAADSFAYPGQVDGELA
jgi:hypothetical protein